MKYRDDMKIQFSTDDGRVERFVFYRIDPSELNFFNRVFRNPWRQIYRAAYYGLAGTAWSFESVAFKRDIMPCNTLGKIKDYLKRQDWLIEKNSLHKKKNDYGWPNDITVRQLDF